MDSLPNINDTSKYDDVVQKLMQDIEEQNEQFRESQKRFDEEAASMRAKLINGNKPPEPPKNETVQSIIKILESFPVLQQPTLQFLKNLQAKIGVQVQNIIKETLGTE